MPTICYQFVPPRNQIASHSSKFCMNIVSLSYLLAKLFQATSIPLSIDFSWLLRNLQHLCFVRIFFKNPNDFDIVVKIN